MKLFSLLQMEQEQARLRQQNNRVPSNKV